MADLVSDMSTANELADLLTDIDISGAVRLSQPISANITGLTVGILVGNNLRGAFDKLNGLVDSKAENLRQIAQIMVEADAQLAGGTP